MKDSFLTILRDKKTTQKDFRKASERLATILAAEEASKLKEKKINVETNFSLAEGKEISQKVSLIPILRSGITLLPAFLSFFEHATIGVLGIRRDETTYKPTLYYENLASIDDETLIIILDPMIATGGTICLAAKLLIQKGAKESNIKVVSIISSLEGIKMIKEKHKELSINSVAIDPKLNAQKYIVPGLGDFGDRFFGTL
jgi:uracil phosphoribosyltransferase